jgi:hypothetical protein
MRKHGVLADVRKNLRGSDRVSFFLTRAAQASLAVVGRRFVPSYLYANLVYENYACGAVWRCAQQSG